MNEPLLKNAPIREAIIEFQTLQTNSDIDALKGFIKKNETEYPNIKEKIGFQLSARFGVEASDVKSSKNIEGYILSDESKKKVIQISVNKLSIHIIKPYDCWNNFMNIVYNVWEKYISSVELNCVKKISIRYINEIEIDLTEIEILEKHLKMLPKIPKSINSNVNHFFMQLGLNNKEKDIYSIINQSFNPPNNNILPYIFDIEVYIEKDYFNWDKLWEDIEIIRDFKNNIFFNGLSKHIIKKYK